MTESDNEFISVFNEYYPFERYIVKTPKPINYLFDDVVITELFVPYTEIKPVLYNGNFVEYTCVNEDEIYVKVKGNAGEMRFSYFDFSKGVRETIQDIIIDDMGAYEYESLYVDHEDGNVELIEMLKNQKSMIMGKYGECNLKKSVRENLI